LKKEEDYPSEMSADVYQQIYVNQHTNRHL